MRADSHLYAGCEVSPFYDPMIVKIIVKGSSRLEAVRRLRRALEELIIEGIRTNADFMNLLTYHPEFIRGNYTTAFWENYSKTIEQWYQEGMQTDA